MDCEAPDLPRVVGEDGGITGAKVERASGRIADEDCGLGLALVEVKPFLSLRDVCEHVIVYCILPRFPYIRVPVQFAQAAWLKSHKGSSKSLADREVRGVNLPELASMATNCLWGMLESAIDKRAVTSGDGRGRVRHVERAHGRVDNVGVGRWDVVENRLVDSEILCEDRFGSVGNPIIDIERGAVTVLASHGVFKVPS